ncbi:glycosyltransferase family 4 protein [Granulosicoccus antarcticus]|uniref:GDP-mannose-dependent alpha-(1-6)-phosphatidylinositol monomannoside mannosyltransferase n=1 Tax=Granulosicoccus antarcticus IMCC3135 TaxID=1192854 RepID=A0A2Z2NZT6_9GAMM|nr:glycosyltransferase family 4 protein [Granulosicoccus antarcticus]ASJ75955.1 GDP-mannose-dependent alpha-(1-6)-phosphatidylinositol monomannoside mannosyltransferase [Granulosicoccus antarcticus IMCC3135]
MINQIPRKLVVVLKGYPRLSETFIAQELLGLEQAGIELQLVSLRHPTDNARHAVHDEIRAPVNYLPEYLHQEPGRVLRSFFKVMTQFGFFPSLRKFASDLLHDRTRNRIRRFGQGVVLAAEWPADTQWLHAHFIHTPASVGAYASQILGIPWSVSAHAKDIWTSSDRELADKLASARWVVTCTEIGHRHLQSLAPNPATVHLSYHGIDLDRFPSYHRQPSLRDASKADEPVVILSVGRAVGKKGFDTLLDALAGLPAQLHWRFVHIGAGTELVNLQAQARSLGIDQRISWLGAINQSEVLANYQSADLFVLACRIADDGDRDGLPNVLVEAASQGLPCVSTRVSAIPELFTDEQNALLVEPDDAQALSAALARVFSAPDLRDRLGQAAQEKVRSTLDYHVSIRQLVGLFEEQWNKTL